MIENQFLEIISTMGHPLTYIIRHETSPESTTFLTPPEFKQQVGFIVYPAGGVVKRHVHRQMERKLVGTSEVLYVLKGHALVDIYDNDHQLIDTRELFVGDLILMVSGGHGFRMLEDTTFLEIKQGPYIGIDEKELF